jgi:transcription elongation factor GreB
MSKAFLRESDDAGDEPVLRPLAPLLPGQKNLITAEGAQLLRDELTQLLSTRPPLVAQNQSPDAKRELQQLDHRIRQLERSLRVAEIVPPSTQPSRSVEFGSYVTVRTAEGEESHYRIVGPDETNPPRGWISHQSPLARGLIGATVSHRVIIQTPRGPSELTVIAVEHIPSSYK